MVSHLCEQGLIGRISASQCVEPDLVSVEIDLAACESMRPVGRQAKAVAEHVDFRRLITSSQEDHGACRIGRQIQSEALRERTANRRMVSSPYAACSMRSHIGRRQLAKMRHVRDFMALPYLALPQGIETFDRILEAVLSWRRKYRNDTQGKAQAADPADRIGPLMRTLELRAIVELRIDRQSITSPTLDESLQSELCRGLLQGPSVHQTAMDAGAGKHRHERPIGDLQLFNKVEAVEFRVTCRDRRQIPATRRRRPTLTPSAVLRSISRQSAVDRSAGRHHRRLLSLQRTLNRLCAALAEHAVRTKDVAKLQQTLLGGVVDAIPAHGAAWRPVIEIHTVQALTRSSLNPQIYRAKAHAKTIGHCTNTRARANGAHDPAPLLNDMQFLVIAMSHKKPEPYFERSAIAEP